MTSIFKNFSKTTKIWLTIAALSFIFILFTYIEVQQVLRIGANELPLQIAEDYAATLANSVPPASIVPNGVIDVAKSLTPFVIIFDDKGTPVASSVQLNGKTPIPPAGVFEYARAHGKNRLTWEPQPGIRIAAIIIHYTTSQTSGGFVLGGKSLREIENRDKNAFRLALLAWLGTLLVSFFGVRLLFGKEKPAFPPIPDSHI